MKILQVHDCNLSGPTGDTRAVNTDPLANVCEGRAGGMAVYLNDLIEALRDRGNRVSVVRFMEHPSGKAAAISADENYHELAHSTYRYRPDTHARFARILESEAPDVVQTHSLAMHPRMLRSLIRQHPIVCMIHDVMPVCFRYNKLHPDGTLCTRPIGFRCVTSGCYRLGSSSGIVRDVIRVLRTPSDMKLYRSLPHVVVPSAYLKEVLLTNGFRAKHVHAVPLFSRFERDREPVVNNAQPPTILYVGRLAREKGILSFLDALSMLASEEWRAVIVGDGDQLSAAREQVSREPLAGRVTLAGEASRAALMAHYRACDLVVLPSLVPESFGLVGVEAMSFGKPVVAFRSGGVTEWLIDGVTGLLADHGDVRQLADHMDRLFGDAPRRTRLGQAGFESLTRCFTINAHVDRLLNLFEQSIQSFAEVNP